MWQTILDRRQIELRTCVAVAPCSTSNLGPGYDVFGLALDPLKDRVEITKGSGKANRIILKMKGEGCSSVPLKAESNSAGLVIKRMAQDFQIKDDLTVTVVKGIPTGSGIGSSGASAVASALAFDRLFDLRLEKTKLVAYAVEGEMASAGTKHYDNVAPSLLGGFVIVRMKPTLEFIRIEPPRDLILVVAVPMIEVPNRKTAFARSILPKKVPLESIIHNVSNASLIVAGFYSKDVGMIARGINDAIVEPSRKHLIPGYEAVKRRALEAGALAATISGAGPSMISFLRTNRCAKQVAQAMSGGFEEANIKSRTIICRPSDGAKVLTRRGRPS